MSEVIDKATRCERLLKDEDLQQAFQDVRDALHQRFERTSVTDGDTLLDIRKMLHLLDSVWANLSTAVENGKLEEFRLKQSKISYLGDLWQKKSNKI